MFPRREIDIIVIPGVFGTFLLSRYPSALYFVGIWPTVGFSTRDWSPCSVPG